MPDIEARMGAIYGFGMGTTLVEPENYFLTTHVGLTVDGLFLAQMGANYWMYPWVMDVEPEIYFLTTLATKTMLGMAICGFLWFDIVDKSEQGGPSGMPSKQGVEKVPPSLAVFGVKRDFGKSSLFECHFRMEKCVEEGKTIPTRHTPMEGSTLAKVPPKVWFAVLAPFVNFFWQRIFHNRELWQKGQKWQSAGKNTSSVPPLWPSEKLRILGRYVPNMPLDENSGAEFIWENRPPGHPGDKHGWFGFCGHKSIFEFQNIRRKGNLWPRGHIGTIC